MKAIDDIALRCGIKYSEPHVNIAFFPPPCEKYIIIENSSNEKYREYEFIDEISAILFPFLTKNNIRLIQIKFNRNDLDIFKCKKYESLSHPQFNFLIQNSLGVITNNFYTHYIAAASNVNSICLHPNSFTSVNSPEINKDKCLDLISSPQTFPEKICARVLENLKIESLISKINPIYCGKDYHTKKIEVIPDFNVEQSNIREQRINIRADYYFDEKNIAKLLATNKCNLITDKLISLDYLKNPIIHKNILEINYEVSQNTTEEDINTLQMSGCKFNLFCKDQNNINEIRLKHLDYEISIEETKTKKDLDIKNNICHNCFYKSSKVLLSKGKQYSSKSKWLLNKEINKSQFELIEDDKNFWQEIDNFKIFSINE